MASRRGHGHLIAGLVVALLTAAWAPAAPAAPPPAGGGVAKSPPSPPPKTPGRARNAALPSRLAATDTVLARIGADRVVTAAAFRRGWGQVSPPDRPDSLTPETARRFLDLLIDKELLARRAAREAWHWTTFESLQVANLRDRTVMRVSLDSAMLAFARRRAARGDSALAPEALGVAARESTVARMEVTYDEALLASLAGTFAALPRPSPDSSLMVRLRLMGQMPAIERADSARAIAWSSAGTYHVGDIVDAWKRLNPLFRPRIETSDQVRDLVKNGLFERALRREAARTGLERDPRVVEVVRRQSELNDVEYLVKREVYAPIPADSVTLRRFYEQQPGTWQVPERVRVVRLVLPERDDALRMMERLRDRAEADSLVARGARQRVQYGIEATLFSDSILFTVAKQAGAGAVLGPVPVAAGWQVTRVNEIVPAHVRTLDEALDLVHKQWITEEGERRMRAFLDGLRRETPVTVNDGALARLVREGVPAAERARNVRSPAVPGR